jgi:MFS family permease
MPAISAAVAALLLSVVLLQVANGMFASLLGVRLGIEEGVSTQTAGLVMSGYFVGMTVGCLIVPRVIEQVGHVRTFAAVVSIASAASISHAFFVDPWFWFALRVVFGVCIAGSYMVAESWLNGATSNDQRGGLLSIYMVLQTLAIAGGQYLLNLAEPTSFILYALVSILFSLAVVPLTLSRGASSTEVAPSALSFRQLYELSPLGVVGSFGAGVLNGAIFGTASVFATAIGFSVSEVAIFVSAGIIGGLVLQWPIGKASDWFDRRTVIAGSLLTTTVLGATLAFLPYPGFWPFTVIAGAYGGIAFTLYSLAIAHANDFIEEEDLVQASAGLLLAFGIGAVIGPIVSTSAMDVVGDAGFYGFGALISAVVLAFALWRMTRRPAVPLEDQGPWVPVSRTTPMAAELDPRWDPEESGSEEGAGTDTQEPGKAPA